MSKPRAPRLTKAEWGVIWACLQFVKAGEIDGGPLEGETDADTDNNQDLFDSVIAKLEKRDF